MNRLLVAGLVVVLSCTAHAGGNPDIRAYFDFDPPNYVHEIHPAPYATVDAYLCLDHVGEGVTSVCFRMEDPVEACPGTAATAAWTKLFPGGFIPMTPWDGAGVTVPSSECMTSDPVIAGYVTIFYLGGSCCLEILDHGVYPRWVVDCGDPGDVDSYCVLAHGSIGGAGCPEGDCSPVRVEGETWGTIKSLYR